LENLKSSYNVTSNSLPYICCNETQQYETLKGVQERLASLPASKDLKVHLGFSVWFNLDLIAETCPDYAIILDIDPNVIKVYKCLENSFTNSNHPDEFVEYFLKELYKKNVILLEDRSLVEFNAREELLKGFGFLCSKKDFLSVKSMCDEGRIFFGKADITNEEEMGQLILWRNENNVRFSTLYLSNIPEWILENATDVKQNAFKENVLKLKDSNTYIIDAFYPTKDKIFSGPPQRFTQGELPTFTRTVDKKKGKGRGKFSRNFFSSDSPENKSNGNVSRNLFGGDSSPNNSSSQSSDRKNGSLDEIDDNPSKDMEGPKK
jgi:hypothetical protein